MAYIEAKKLVKIYNMKKNEVRALDGLDLTVDKGEFLAVVGASGSGKSTLMHVLAGLDRPTAGSIIIDGKEITALSRDELVTYRRRKAGVIYQFFNLVSVLNAEENIVLPSSLDGKKIDYERLDALLEQLNLEDRRNHYPSELSGGQQQRVAIARAIYNEPEIILADEPTGNLDSVNSKEVIGALQKLNKQYGKTLILITHDRTIADMADRTVTISDGRIIEQCC